MSTVALDPIYSDHLKRLKAAVLEGQTLEALPEWIEKNTRLRGRPFSFKDHEYQLHILRDGSREKVIRKCSQVGISELSAREALAILMVLDGTTGIYTLPTAEFAKTFAKTRIDPIIAGSDALKFALNPTADNTGMKQLNDSFLYIKGTVGANAAISIPADLISNDEVDFSDHEIMSNYQSRLTHSPWKLKRKWSTPTVEGYGISAEFAASRRHWNFVKCNHCGHFFLPNYFDHVVIPGFYDDLRSIDKERLPHTRYREAYLACPKCKKAPSLAPEHREWVCENPGDDFVAAGYQIQPFDAPAIITIPDLIAAGASYKRYVDFVNFGLGLPAEDKETSISREELLRMFVERGALGGFFTHVMGVDLGMICHIIISGVDHLGQMYTVHTERVPVGQLKQRYHELRGQFRVTLTVMDSQPYTETVMELQQDDANLYGAVYVTSKDISTFVVKRRDGGEEEGKSMVRQVNINRNRAFDAVMGMQRQGQWVCVKDENQEILLSHLTDMKRVRNFTSDEELAFVWKKSAKGDDHFHHALLYCYIAAQMRGVAGPSLALPMAAGKFRVKSEQEKARGR